MLIIRFQFDLIAAATDATYPVSEPLEDGNGYFRQMAMPDNEPLDKYEEFGEAAVDSDMDDDADVEAGGSASAD